MNAFGCVELDYGSWHESVNGKRRIATLEEENARLRKRLRTVERGAPNYLRSGTTLDQIRALQAADLSAEANEITNAVNAQNSISARSTSVSRIFKQPSHISRRDCPDISQNDVSSDNLETEFEGEVTSGNNTTARRSKGKQKCTCPTGVDVCNGNCEILAVVNKGSNSASLISQANVPKEAQEKLHRHDFNRLAGSTSVTRAQSLPAGVMNEISNHQQRITSSQPLPLMNRLHSLEKNICRCHDLHPLLASGEVTNPIRASLPGIGPMAFAENIRQIAVCDAHGREMKEWCLDVVKEVSHSWHIPRRVTPDLRT